MSEQSLLTALHQVCTEIRDSEMEALKTTASKDKQPVALNRGQVFELSERIQSLPQINRDILLARYCYKMSAEETDNIYGVTDAKGKCLYAEKLLGYALDLSDNETISPGDLAAACKTVDERISREIKLEAGPRAASAISRKHERRMRDILKRGGKPSKLSLAMRYAATFTLVLLLSGVITLSVNAELREKFFNWVITTYQEFSAFGKEPYSNSFLDPSEIQMSDHAAIAEESDNLASYAMEFIPDGFYLTEQDVSTNNTKRRYTNPDGHEIVVIVSEPDGTHLFDTEDSEIQTITLFGQDAFLWQRRVTFLVFQMDGLLCGIMSDLNLGIDTAIEIAQSMKRYESTKQADGDKPVDQLLSEIMRMRPKYVPQEMSLTSFSIDVNHASYFYTDEYGLETAVYVQRTDGASGETEVSGFTEWPVNGYFQTWNYGNYKCMINSNINAEKTKKMALSMQYDK